MTSGECFENKWFYMKYIGKYLSAEILLTREYMCVHKVVNKLHVLKEELISLLWRMGGEA